MTTFFVIRHASCDPLGRYLAGRAPGIPLNDLGRHEAALLAERLSNVGPRDREENADLLRDGPPFAKGGRGGISATDARPSKISSQALTALYSSPLERAQETAAFVAKATGLTVVTAPEFIEVEFGEWTGSTFEELNRDPRWKRYNRFRSDSRPPGGESFAEIQARALAGLERLRARHPEEQIAVVSHGDVIKALVMHYAGIPTDYLHRIEISPASVSVLQLEDWGPKILRVNDTGEGLRA